MPKGIPKNGINKGWFKTPEMRRKMSIAHKGKKLSEDHKRNIGLVNLGKKLSEETKRKLSEAHKGKHHSPNTQFKKGHTPFRYWLGKKLSQEHIKKLIETHLGERASNWRGGISFEPYSIDWTKTLKRSIRERDHYTCRVCGKEPAVSVHHIDYNKKNCNSENLITLCVGCHTRTGFDRDYWIAYFKKL